jgi:hypothetical protein
MLANKFEKAFASADPEGNYNYTNCIDTIFFVIVRPGFHCTDEQPRCINKQFCCKISIQNKFRFASQLLGPKLNGSCNELVFLVLELIHWLLRAGVDLSWS